MSGAQTSGVGGRHEDSFGLYSWHGPVRPGGGDEACSCYAQESAGESSRTVVIGCA